MRFQEGGDPVDVEGRSALIELGVRALELVAESRLTFDNARESLARVAAIDRKLKSTG